MTSLHGVWASPAATLNGSGNTHLGRSVTKHVTFFWGHNTEVLFPGWPGPSSAMYGLSLVLVFALAVIVEWLTHSGGFVRPGASDAAARLVRTAVHMVRSGLAYMVMLAVMSFNGGVFLAALGGHAVGFLVFRTRALMKSDGSGSDTQSDRPTTKV